MKNIVIALVATCSFISNEASASCSSGFLADVLCQTGVINQDTANGLDQVHKGVGNPLDNVVPSFPGGFAQPVGGPQFQPPQANNVPQVAWGNYCVTQWGAAYGAANPVGTPCTAIINGYPVMGYVGR
ncbi:hypothetical protein [Ensifer sp. Root142]|uniref:hypothetical protein n=1 Tax=Ensifer sp. Root142 TaxID=1736461 RepID=UPI000AD9E91C|nr:hypothetical protein [Ensifer sp. Root142]